VAEVYRKLGISEATFYAWKKKVQRTGPGCATAFAPSEEENPQLKWIVGDLTLHKQMLEDVLKNSFEGAATPAANSARRL
jgi:putative transposase